MRNVKRVVLAGIIGVIVCAGINQYVLAKSQQRISHNIKELPEAYTAIVLGARVYQNGGVSNYLKDRLEHALELYNSGKIERFLVSGDHGQKDYDEVNTMKQYLMNNGVPKEVIFLDHAGFNTYSSMVRAKKVFQVEDAIIVSQDYHLPRAVFIANQVGLNAHGYASSSSVLGQSKRNKIREVLARVKSFGEVMLGVDPKYLGNPIPITGSSIASHD